MKEAQLVARWLHDLSGYTAEAPSRLPGVATGRHGCLLRRRRARRLRFSITPASAGGTLLGELHVRSLSSPSFLSEASGLTCSCGCWCLVGWCSQEHSAHHHDASGE